MRVLWKWTNIALCKLTGVNQIFRFFFLLKNNDMWYCWQCIVVLPRKCYTWSIRIMEFFSEQSSWVKSYQLAVRLHGCHLTIEGCLLHLNFLRREWEMRKEPSATELTWTPLPGEYGGARWMPMRTWGLLLKEAGFDETSCLVTIQPAVIHLSTQCIRHHSALALDMCSAGMTSALDSRLHCTNRAALVHCFCG